jgi:hypothetical protein
LHRPFFDVKITAIDVIARCLLNQYVDLKILMPATCCTTNKESP